jgi:cell wall-associated NlpC family hydrolase
VQEPLNVAIRQQVSRDQRTLRRLRRTQTLDRALLVRTRARVLRAADPFPAEDQARRLQQAVSREAAAASRVGRSIHGLELALQPVVVPQGFSSEPSAAIGAYAVSIAERYLGVRYLWGGADPSSGFDCSGFVQFVYAQLGISLPHYAAAQYATTPHISLSQLEPGDLVEPRSDGPGHVGMYVGEGVFIEAPHTGDVVKFAQLSVEANEIGFVGASRPAAGRL